MNYRYFTFASLIALLLAAMLCMCGCSGCSSGCIGQPRETEEPPDQIVDIDAPPEYTQSAWQSEQPTDPAQTEWANPTETPGPISPDPTLEPGEITFDEEMAFLAANSRGTYGVASDGSIRYIGRSTSGQHLIYDWKNVAGVTANESTTAAVLKNGTVVFAGKQVKSFSTASSVVAQLVQRRMTERPSSAFSQKVKTTWCASLSRCPSVRRTKT